MNKLSLILLLIGYYFNIYAFNKVPYKQIASNADIRNYCLTPGSLFFYAANQNIVELYDLKTSQLVDSIRYSDSTQIKSLVLSKDSMTLVTGFSDGFIIIHDLLSNNRNKIKASDFMITTIAIQSNIIALGTYNGEVIFIDKAGNILDRKKSHDDVVTKVVISSEGRLMASTGMDGKLNIYNLRQKNSYYCLIKKAKPCRDVEISLDTKYLLVCFDNGRIENWRINYDNSIQLIESDHIKGWAIDICIYSDNITWAACSANGEIVVKTSFGPYYKTNLRVPLLQINFVPLAGLRLTTLVSAYKSGLKIINAADMKMKN
jgi:WD40 repeat protein